MSNIIAVGTVSPCGERKSPSSCDGEGWGSNYGAALDVVAPGVLIPTTDIQKQAGYNPKNPTHIANGGNKITSDYSNQNYTVWFNGTSATCPQVAGIATIILSVNPDLTAKQVRDVIEQTAQKVGGYTYTNSTIHPQPMTRTNELRPSKCLWSSEKSSLHNLPLSLYFSNWHTTTNITNL